MVVQDRNCKPNGCLSESFTNANATSAQKRSKSQRVPGPATRCLIPLTGRVKAFWLKLVRHLPLGLVVMHAFDVDPKAHVFHKHDIVDLDVAFHALNQRNRKWWLHSQGLVKTFLEVVKVHHCLVCQVVDDIILNTLDRRKNLV
jgi:hypothetical protein